QQQLRDSTTLNFRRTVWNPQHTCVAITRFKPELVRQPESAVNLDSLIEYSSNHVCSRHLDDRGLFSRVFASVYHRCGTSDCRLAQVNIASHFSELCLNHLVIANVATECFARFGVSNGLVKCPTCHTDAFRRHC